MSKKANKVKKEPTHIREFTFEQLQYIKTAVEYHKECWKHMYSDSATEVAKEVNKIL